MRKQKKTMKNQPSFGYGSKTEQVISLYLELEHEKATERTDEFNGNFTADRVAGAQL